VLPELHPEQAGYTFDVRERAGQEMPATRIRRPGPRVLLERGTAIELGIDGDREQDHVLAEPALETPLQLGKIAGESEAVRGIRAAHVGEREHGDRTGQTGQRHGLPRL